MVALHLSFLQAFHVVLPDGTTAGFRSAKTQALLAYLALSAERPHRRDVLAGLLWPDQPQQAAHHNLSQALLNLRQAIGDRHAHSPFLLVTRQTIQFNPASSHWMDVAAFVAHRATCLIHPHHNLESCEPCMRRLKQAVELYRGPLLAEFSLHDSNLFEEWVLLKREWLHRQVVETLDLLIGYFERRQDYGRAQQYARRQVELDPLRESAHRHLMRVLARGGQRSAALGQYDICRRGLAEELNVEPTAETTALYQHIRVGGLDRAGSERRSHLDRSAAPDMGSLYGREAELTTLERWIVGEHCRLLAIVGMGGVGKTALAAALAEALGDHFDVVIWRSLRNAPSLAELLSSCLHMLSAHPPIDLPPSLDALLDLFLDHLHLRRCLLVFDNYESILQSVCRAGLYRPDYANYGQLLQRFSQSRHQSCLVLTSRELPADLAVTASAGTRVFQLPGLMAEAGQAILQERGIAGAAGDATALVQRYSGNPLALKLAAETIRSLFAGKIAAFLGGATPIFEDMRDVLDEQFARLSQLERELLIRLAIERAPLTLAGLQAGLSCAEAPGAILEAMRSLQRRSLLEQREDMFTLQNVVITYATERFVMPETIPNRDRVQDTSAALQTEPAVTPS